MISQASIYSDETDLDHGRLEEWLRAHIQDYVGPIFVHRFPGGQSNPTYRLDTPTRSYVLRRKPTGSLLQSAHAVDREFQVLDALHNAGFPVPRAYALCDDTSVVGAMFYVMEMIDGRIMWDGRLPDHDPQERAAIWDAQISTLARLHRLEPQKIGLADYGAKGNYFGRQVARWSKQYKASEDRTIPEMERLIQWLPASLPEERPARIVHGDFRLDNMVFAHDRNEVSAVLDWELSTLGDPIADLTYFLAQWVMPNGQRNSLAGIDFEGMGIPTLNQALSRYAELTGTPPLDNPDWYFAYNLFRLAAILQGIVGRTAVGNASNADASSVASRIIPLAKTAWHFAERAGASR